MTLFLRISICLLIFGCASYPEQNNFKSVDRISAFTNPYFSDLSKDYVYKANIEFYDHNFGGLFIVKKLGDQQHRIVFTTEMGNKIFDFSFNANDFKVNFILDELDKKMLINILKNDFKVLITENLKASNSFVNNEQTIHEVDIDGKTYFYFYSQSLNKIVNVPHRKAKVTFLFKDINDNIVERIQIMHSNIKLNINLKTIN